ncbi:ABC transporter substrate-binding protein [Marinibaculum pumilum]|uniref:ABC transporter substrate-binding protein n=1 Tax=Marinibaculum pumilum TaxID=1766165 RepID=A0ABV7KY14_9PROT
MFHPAATSGATPGARRGSVAALLLFGLAATVLLAGGRDGAAAERQLQEAPALAEMVAKGELPPVADRVPQPPMVVDLEASGQTVGKPGGTLHTLIGRARDVRLLVVYGYARLVGYDSQFNIRPDILESLEISDGGRTFTMTLRAGHKWSDGEPFTAEDFRYWWEDVATEEELSPTGPPIELVIDGERPKVTFPDDRTVVYSWSQPNPYFIPRLAGTSPLYIYRPAHYLKQFHKTYAEAADIERMVEEQNVRNWAALHNAVDNLYAFDNPALPTLQPWMNTTEPPSLRFVAVRNPYFHRVDPDGMQLPYIDEVIMNTAAAPLIPAKTAAGESDLQARNIAFSNYTFLRENEERSGYHTYLWRTAKGSHFALFPNLNATDDVWRKYLRDVRFRRALSMAIDRMAINQTLFFGLAVESNNTVLPGSPLHRDEYQNAWTERDIEKANALLDEIGLTERNGDGIRLFPENGQPVEIIVETAGEDTEQTDILELIREDWQKIGVKLFTKPSQRSVLRNRVFSGDAVMSVWTGLEMGVPTFEMSPAELAPTDQYSLQWPKWGQYHQTKGAAGEAPDMPVPKQLYQLHKDWLHAQDPAEKKRIWHEMLSLYTDQVFTIGVVAGVPQPVVVSRKLHNVPEEAIYNWDPGAFFGIYGPDSFWFDQ